MSNKPKVDPDKGSAHTKDHQHRFRDHFKKAGKKLGFWGGILLALHILFHIVEILILPTLLVWLGIKS